MKKLFIILLSLLLVASVSASLGANWTQATPNAEWSSRLGFNILNFENKSWLFDGYDGNGGMFNDVWSSTNLSNWTLITASANWNLRTLSSSVVFDGKMWLMGGTDNSYAMLNDVWSSADGINWTEETSSANWSPRREHNSVVFDNKIWVFAGLNGTYSSLNDVWSSVDGISWVEVSSNASWVPRSSSSSVVFDGKMWLMGGYFTDDMGNVIGSLNDVWSSADGISWVEVSSNASWVPRSSSSSVVFDGKMWLMGGVDNNINPLNDVWSSQNVCIPSWYCSQLANCNNGGVLECLNVVDSQSCSVSFTGNVSTYNVPADPNLLSACVVAGASVFTMEGIFIILTLLIGFGFLFVKKPIWAGLIFILWTLIYNKNIYVGMAMLLFSAILIYKGWKNHK